MSSKTIFITGAARGIGRACAERFAAEGYRVGLYDIDAGAVAETAEALVSRHGPDCCRSAVCDVRDPDSIRAAFAHFQEFAGGRLDVLLNNAGVMSVGRFEEVDPGDHQRMIAINFQGVVDVAQLGFELLRATKGARLINMSSASAIMGIPRLAVYSATKHAVRGLSEALDVEWERFDIRVCDVMPLYVETDLLHNTATAPSTARLGVRLVPRDVADVVWRAANSRRRRVHWPVGPQGKLAYHAGKHSPAALERLLSKYVMERDA